MKERHAQILEAIKSFYQENGFCPTVRQIGDMVGLYITEHEVEGGEKSGKQYFIPENEKGC